MFLKIKRLENKKIDYPNFLATYYDCNLQKETLLNLYYLTKFYKASKIQTNENYEKPNHKHPFCVENRHKLHLLKISLLDNKQCIKEFEIDNSFLNLQNFIFILAMLKKRPDIVYKFLKIGFPKSINCSTFATELSPTYFHLACVLNEELLRLFIEFSPSYSLSYNGLTPQMLLVNKKLFLYDKQEWKFMTTMQYYLLCQFNMIQTVQNEENPLFLIDFLCLCNQKEKIKNMLKVQSDLILYSRYCFVFSYSFELMAELLEYSIDINQSFCQITPLHIAAYINDINYAVASLIVSMDCNAQDYNGDTPLHIAARLKNYTILELFIRYSGDVNIKNKQGKTPKDLYEENNWKMVPPNYTDNDVLINLADMDYNNPEFKCSSVSMKHIMSIKNFKRQSRFKITSLLSFYSLESETKKRLEKLRTSIRYNYKTFCDLDSKIEQHLYKV